MVRTATAARSYAAAAQHHPSAASLWCRRRQRHCLGKDALSRPVRRTVSSGSWRRHGCRAASTPFEVRTAAVALAPGHLVALVVNTQVLNGLITPLLLTYMLILANRSTVLGTAKNGPIFKAVATPCVAVVGLRSFVVLIQTIFGLG